MAGELALLRTQIVTHVSTSFGTTGVTHAELTADLLSRDFRVPANEARWRVGVGVIGTVNPDSEAAKFSVDVRVQTFFRPAVGVSHLTWIATNLDVLSRDLADPKAWRAYFLGIASVPFYDIVGGPEVSYPEQVGNVVFTEYVIAMTMNVA